MSTLRTGFAILVLGTIIALLFTWVWLRRIVTCIGAVGFPVVAYMLWEANQTIAAVVCVGLAFASGWLFFRGYNANVELLQLRYTLYQRLLVILRPYA
jgi:hypothetical protein